MVFSRYIRIPLLMLTRLIRRQAELKDFENRNCKNADAAKKPLLDSYVSIQSQIIMLLSRTELRSNFLRPLVRCATQLVSKAVLYPAVVAFTQALFVNLRHKSESDLTHYKSPRDAILHIFESGGISALYSVRQLTEALKPNLVCF
jgi:hypothetical protein